MTMLGKVLLTCLAATLLTACQSVGHQKPTEVQAALNEAYAQSTTQPLSALPDAVTDDLMGDFSDPAGGAMVTEKRLRINANNIDAKAFFGSLVQGTDFNLVMHPDVSGKITVSLKDVTVKEALDVVSDIYGYSIETQGRLIQIFPAALRTETFAVDYLQLQRAGVSLTSISTGAISTDSGSSSGDSGEGSERASKSTGGTVIETRSESSFWMQLERAVSAMIGSGEGRSIVVSPQASLITVKAFPNELREVKRFLEISEKRLKRQVILEAKILEVTLSDGYQQGVNWSNISKSIGSGGIDVSRPASDLAGDLISNVIGGQTNITITDGHFDAVLSFLDTQGDVNVLSSPRVTAANNQKAVIKVGGDEYFVTDISSSDSSGDNSESGPNIELTPFFSGISLDVTPQIDDDNGVLLHVHPAVIDVVTEEKTIQLGSASEPYVLPLAKTSIRESDSIIHARSGDVVVIGGLMKSSFDEKVSKVPLLGDIPGLGHLFRNVNRLKQKTELVILLQPSVVGEQTWQEEIQRSRELLNEWFPENDTK
ncbi:pilus (MSHA type) biogenesis protein MshL [Enterovibrio norvegicus]|uniref:pilus (MSHA type) biogenesis protein MshL n=1 Tax=Enterovibrio norvegicus TaxID=188144 RepID=UPI000C83A4CD|nr:pilus (MSHA type) biogenesis protein MshL [Enterovibrio norvegicus]MCC4799509.1 pilus (MSHA type) biogenesis protein MshL [Enterovibrio norvegicus]PMH64851.1 pilus (MSHA type) biogenesis protein MshL [Enterovibrio norvegicus]PMI31580.1 pilus (MSHA type) biogenesis protein MshL [Enterovibrio norvegicus]PMI36786.1 pilus (MSHA type) biogenesis protein MshL [Enterovibrio norvegicus]PMN50221.1 pilus (MSHA type) biogenesis protein MshL [Enterovibrio norvegicus]